MHQLVAVSRMCTVATCRSIERRFATASSFGYVMDVDAYMYVESVMGYAPINCKPPPPRETMGDLTASLCPGVGNLTTRWVTDTLTDASLHCDLRVYRVHGAV